MFKKTAIAAGAAILMATASVSYGWGLPSVPGLGGGSGGGGADVDTFLTQGAASTKLINTAKLNLALALSSKEEKDKLTALMAQNANGADAKDKTATESPQLVTASEAALKAAESDNDTQQRVSSLSSDQKKGVATSLYNLALGVYQQKAQIVTGQNIIKSAAGNVSLASKLPAVKDSIADMGSNISTGGEYLAKFPGLFKSAGIDPVLPTDASGKPQDEAFPSL